MSGCPFKEISLGAFKIVLLMVCASTTIMSGGPFKELLGIRVQDHQEGCSVRPKNS